VARFGTIFGQFFHLAEGCIPTMLLIMSGFRASCRRHGGGQRDSRSSWAAAGSRIESGLPALARTGAWGDSYPDLVEALRAHPSRLAKTG
jgi:hypothetical protein